MPEVATGVIELRAVARIQGRRTKVAVTTIAPEVDPVGACVGWKGRLGQAIVTELGGERLDILLWSDVPQQFVKAALAPARVHSVEVDLQHLRAVAYVSSDQLDLALGRDGENRTLATELTGWSVEIVALDAV